MAADKDTKFKTIYLAGTPTQDRRNHPALVPEGAYPRLTGVDGRFLGSFRRFPGFDKLIDLKDYQVDSSGDVDNLYAVYFFKYLAVQVAVGLERANDPDDQDDPLVPIENATSRILRGFAVAHHYVDDTATPDTRRGVLRYIYYDPKTGAWATQILLQEVSLPGAWDDRYMIDAEDGDFAAIIDANAEYDVSSMGPFLYFCLNRGTPLGLLVDEIDGVGRDPRDYYRKSVRVVSTGATSLEWHYTNLGPLQSPTNVGAELAESDWAKVASVGHLAGTVRAGLRVYSTYKNVEGPLKAVFNLDADDAEGDAYWNITLNADTYWPKLATLGLQDHLLGSYVRGFRSVDSDLFDAAGGASGLNVVGGTMFREYSNEVHPFNATWANHYDYDGDAADSRFAVYVGQVADGAIPSLARLDPFKDDTALCPRRIKLLQGYQGTLLRVGSMPLAAYPAVNVDREEVLSWGSLRKYAPEEFRIQDATPLGSRQDEQILSLHVAGDYAFAVGDSSIFRIHRNGEFLVINEVQSLSGGVGRHAALGVGTQLVYVSPTGAYIVDGATKEFQLISALDRIIQEDWKDSLTAIRMAYDMRLGALIIHNATEQEAVILWSNTGMITSLKDMLWAFGTEGVNPTDAGHSRSYWINSIGAIYVPNAHRTDDIALTMCGGSTMDGENSYVWNAALREDAHQLHGIIFPGLVSPEVVGFRLYFLSGANKGESRIVDLRTDAGPYEDGTPRTTLVWGSGQLSYLPAEGDVVALARIPFEVVGWPLRRTGQNMDLFISKTVKSLGHNVVLKGGDTTLASNPALVMEHRVYRRGSLDAADIQLRTLARMDADPTKNTSSLTLRGPILYPGWAQDASNLDFELLGGIVHGIMHTSAAESDPALASTSS